MICSATTGHATLICSVTNRTRGFDLQRHTDPQNPHASTPVCSHSLDLGASPGARHSVAKSWMFRETPQTLAVTTATGVARNNRIHIVGLLCAATMFFCTHQSVLNSLSTIDALSEHVPQKKDKPLCTRSQIQGFQLD